MAASIYVHVRTAAQPAGTPLEAVAIAIYDEDNIFLQREETDAAGDVFLGDREAGTYEIRITLVGGSVIGGNRQRITVADIDEEIFFDVIVHKTSSQGATDPRLCRCSGYFIDPSGRPRKIALEFTSVDIPQILSGVGDNTPLGVSPLSVGLVTSDKGYGSIDLIREQRYTVFVSGFSNQSWDVVVPNLAQADLQDVVFPKPQTIEYRLAGELITPVNAPSVMVNQGASITLDVETVFRSGLRYKGLRGLGLKPDDDWWKLSASAVKPGKLVITGKSPGDVNFTVITSPKVEGYGVKSYPTDDFVGNLHVEIIDDPAIPDLEPPVGDEDTDEPLVVDGGEF